MYVTLAFFTPPPVFSQVKFYPAKFLSRLMIIQITFTAIYFGNAKVAGLGEIFVQQKILAVWYFHADFYSVASWKRAHYMYIQSWLQLYLIIHLLPVSNSRVLTQI